MHMVGIPTKFGDCMSSDHVIVSRYIVGMVVFDSDVYSQHV